MTKQNTKPNRIPLLFLALMGVLTLSGCVSTARMLTPTFDELEAKVLRVEVTDGRLRFTTPEVETPGVGGTLLYKNPRAVAFYGGDPTDINPTPEEVIPYRWNLIMAQGIWKEPSLFGTGGVMGGPFSALAADGIPLLKKGDWVDIYIPRAKTLSMRNRSFLTIVRLVCTVEDKDCQKQEKKKLGRVQGQLVQPKGTFDWDSVTITPHFTLDGQWLPGKEVFRPAPKGNQGE